MTHGGVQPPIHAVVLKSFRGRRTGTTTLHRCWLRAGGGRGIQISTTSALVTVRPGALKRPQVLNPVTGAVHE